MPDRFQQPPPDRLIRELATADPTQALYTELVARDSARFQQLSPIPRGTLYSTCVGGDDRINDLFGTLYFLKETVPIGSNTVAGMVQADWVIWYWSTSPQAESVWNATVDYLGDAVANPAYTRAFTLTRDAYDASPSVALGSAYTGLIGIKVTAAGTGYVTTDTVNIAGGLGGLGGAARLVVTETGAVSHVVITASGSGYNSASLPAVTITTSTGSGATLVAIVQPAAAILTSQKKIEFPESDPRSHHFIQTIRTYEVLPGPWIPSARYDENLGPVQQRRRQVVSSGQVASLTGTAKTFYESVEGSYYKLWEIQETYSNGTGSAGNPAYPILVSDTWDNDLGAGERTTQLVVKTGSEVASSTHSGGVVTKTEYIEFNEFLLKKVISKFSVPRTLLGQDYDEQFDLVVPFSLVREAAGTSLGVNRAEIQPQGDGTDKVKTADPAQLIATLGAYLLSFPGTADLAFPDELESVTGVMAKSEGDGEYDETGSGSATMPGGYAISLRGSSQASAAIVPDLKVQIREVWARDVPTINYLFFMPSPVTESQVSVKLTKLAETGATVTITIASPGVVAWSAHGLSNGDTVLFTTTGALPTGLAVDTIYYVVNKNTNDFQVSATSGGSAINTSGTQSGVHTSRRVIGARPTFRPVAHTFTLIGRRLSLQANVSAQISESLSGGGGASASNSEGDGYSSEVGITVRTIRIPPTIHGAITVGSPTSDTAALSVSADVEIGSAHGTRSESDTIAASISPTSLSATTGSTTIPSSGKRIVRINAAPYKYGYVRLQAEVVDFANI